MGETIPERIVKLRHALNLTQSAFADKIYISKSYIASLELGNRRVNTRIIKLICSTFGVREDWLQNGEGPMFADRTSVQIEEIIRLFGKLNPFFQGFFLDQLRRIYEYENSRKTSQNTCA
jgi:transcriptional regulator with XRE-family HTH domain